MEVLHSYAVLCFGRSPLRVLLRGFLQPMPAARGPLTFPPTVLGQGTSKTEPAADIKLAQTPTRADPSARAVAIQLNALERSPHPGPRAPE